MSTRGLQPPVLSQGLWVCLLLIQGSCGRWSHAWWDWDIPRGQEPAKQGRGWRVLEVCECSGMSHHTGVTQDKGISPRGPFQGGFSPGQLPRLPQQTST